MPVTDPELREVAESFKSLAANSFNAATSEQESERVLILLNQAMRTYTINWRRAQQESLQLDSLADCPPGWDACPDGSCVPSGSGCGELLSHKAVLAYIADAAEGYFNSAQSEEMQARTRDLLRAAAESFTTQIAVEEA